MEFNPYNFDNTSEDLSQNTHIMGLSYYKRDRYENALLNLPVQETSQPINIRIPRPATEVPPWNYYAPIPHKKTGMSYHYFDVTQNGSISIQLIADRPDVRYVVFINYVTAPKVNDHIGVYVMPRSLVPTPGKSSHSIIVLPH